jgi:hypothetical protein
MALGFYFHPTGMTAAKYDEVIADLEAAGEGNPKGRTHHSCFGPPDNLMVYDVWDSQEEFETFGATLMPILAKRGVDAGQPDVMPIHHIIQPSR